MHSANFTAFSRVAALLLLLPVPAGAFEQPGADHGDHGKGGRVR
jgi:hypothetical protein